MAVKQERREVSGFDEVQLEGMGVITLQQGEQDSLIIEADAEILPRLKSEVHGGRLELGFKHWYDHMNQVTRPDVHYYITMKQVHGISISGSGELQAGKIETDTLHLRVSGSGDFNVEDLRAQNLEVRFSGTGKAHLGGAAAHQEIHISGSGDLDAAGLDSQSALVRISGSGKVLLQVSQTLEAHISGSGEIGYRGHPSVSPHISGIGRVHSL